jgi:imidazolonepropionase
MVPIKGSELGEKRGVSIAFRGGNVAWIGEAAEAPKATSVVDGSGLIAMPGLVDCHTHSLFAGSRADEFRRRLGGVDYSQILEEGGGILSTVAATRAATTSQLESVLRERLEERLLQGVTTVEVKSGYGLNVETELRMLRILSDGEWPVEISRTFSGAHAIPKEWRHDRGGYVELVLREMLPEAAKLSDQVDVYCDRGAFTVEEAEQILVKGIALGLGGRIHAEQVEHTGAAEMAARVGALSADHLERLEDKGIRAMAAAGMIAVLLPGARLYLRDPNPPVAKLVGAGVDIAIATDFNPGSSPVRDLLACATLACVEFGLSIESALLGVTRNAARVLERESAGWLGVGSAGDMALFAPPAGEPSEYSTLIQYMGGHRAKMVVRNGRLVVDNGALVG